MDFQMLFYNNSGRIRAFWRILIFISLLSFSIAPLILIGNSYLQFIGATLILIFGLYLNAKYLDKRNINEYGLVFKKETLVHLVFGILIAIISVALMLLIGKITGILLVSEFLSMPEPMQVITFAFKMLLVAILEETFFRGYLFTNLYDGFKSKRLSKKKALLISLMLSSLFFGLAHFSNNDASILSIVLLTINGMVWCIPFIMTENLGLSIGLHMAWNFTQTQLGFTMSGNKAVNSFYEIENKGADLLTGGEYGPEAGILGLFGFVVMFLVSLAYLKLIKGKKL
jgi:membrane protease YdiL (CAAX protease family)